MPARHLLPVLGALLLAAACGDGSGPAAGPDTTAPVVASTTTAPFVPGPAVDGLRASVEVSRLFSLDRALALGLQNVGDGEREVVRIALETPLFEPVPFADRTVVLPAQGREYTMPVRSPER